MQAKASTYLRAMAAFWLVFGLGTILYPRMMQLFMTPEGVAASNAFSDQVWLHGGFDILSVCILLFALSTMPITGRAVRLAAIVGLLPTIAMVYTFLTTHYWSHLFFVPAVACLAFAAYGFLLAPKLPES
jgi:hypothetical protein